jgi:aarF domain-containing kinase
MHLPIDLAQAARWALRVVRGAALLWSCTRAPPCTQVDFTKEADHIRQFAGYLDAVGGRAVATCPFVYSQYSSRRLLTLEYFDGVPLTDLGAIRRATHADPEATLINALNTWAGSVMLCDTFHADVHAGNVLVLRDGRVAFIDFGIVGRVSPVTWAAVEALTRGAIASDYRMMAAALATMKATDVEVRGLGLSAGRC